MSNDTEQAPAKLAAWLRSALPADSRPPENTTIGLRKFSGGQSNPTYEVIWNDAPQLVLRRKPDGDLLPSAHAVDREFRVTSALAGTSFPVAHPLALCENPEIMGTMFFVMAHAAGRNFWDPRLPEIDNRERRALYDAMGDTLALLHKQDPEALGLSDFGRSGNYYSRQVARWTKQYRATETERIEAMEQLIDWLPRHMPDTTETRITHGDYRIDNLIFDPAKPNVIAVLDWELSTLGHPLADLAYHVMIWRLSAEQFRGLGGADLTSLNIPSEDEYVGRYLEQTGRGPISPVEWEYAMVYNMFRVACIRQGVLKRGLDGNASNDAALVAGRKARDMAETAWAQIGSLSG